jgi:hypothetical protein
MKQEDSSTHPKKFQYLNNCFVPKKISRVFQKNEQFYQKLPIVNKIRQKRMRIMFVRGSMMQFLSFLMFILLFIIVLYWNRDELRDYLERDRLIGPYVEDNDEQKSFNHTDRVLEGVFRRVRFESQFC